MQHYSPKTTNKIQLQSISFNTLAADTIAVTNVGVQRNVPLWRYPRTEYRQLRQETL